MQLWDCNRERQVRTLLGHSGRVSALAWNRSTLSTGGRDTSILHHDVRWDPASLICLNLEAVAHCTTIICSFETWQRPRFATDAEVEAHCPSMLV